MSTIHVHLRHTFPDFALDAQFDVPARGITALFGPSGSGKTTLLRCVAGLLRADAGVVRVNGEVWQDSGSGAFLPVHKRGAGYVLQEPSLFAHLTVQGNIEYALKRAPRERRQVTFDQAVSWLGIEHLLPRRPHELSGGERQRVAIARAVASNPTLLLMDEPLSALDETSRAEIMPYLVRLHRKLSIPVFYVSHAVHEVARLAEYVVFMEAGKTTRCAPAESAFGELTLAYDKTSLALSVLDGVVAERDTTYGLIQVDTAFGAFWAPENGAARGAHVRIQIAARDVSLGRTHETSTILNQLPCRVEELRPIGSGQVLAILHPQAGERIPLLALITERSRDALGLHSGETVFARVKAVNVAD
ncbi:MAG: molybdenum ABC transporter ATP-binding protein [Candidatus Hydrogenedentales bacterium]|jgi:molybdate transport system ATP-binding protein